MRAHLLLGVLVVLAGCAGASSGGPTDTPVVVEDIYTAAPTPVDDGNDTRSDTATPTAVGNETDSDDRDDDAGETASGDERDDDSTATDDGTEETADDQADEDVDEFWDAVAELMRELDNRSEDETEP